MVGTNLYLRQQNFTVHILIKSYKMFLHVSFLHLFDLYTALADPGGAASAHPPPQHPNSFFFTY